jgi:hypothetical protein
MVSCGHNEYIALGSYPFARIFSRKMALIGNWICGNFVFSGEVAGRLRVGAERDRNRPFHTHAVVHELYGDMMEQFDKDANDVHRHACQCCLRLFTKAKVGVIDCDKLGVSW